MRKLIALALVGGLLSGMLSPASAKPTTVWEDAAGDAGNQDSGVPGADQLGFDLLSGGIEKKGTNLDFTVTHAAMPPMGAGHEATRFMWAFTVDKTVFRITVKWADIGKPNPVTQSDTDRIGKVDVQGFFRLEGDCVGTVVGVLNAINCTTLGYPEGAFDPAAKTFTVSVPMKLIKAKPGSVIAGGGGDAAAICQICWSTHTAERSLNTTNIDTAAQAKTYKVPK